MQRRPLVVNPRVKAAPNQPVNPRLAVQATTKSPAATNKLVVAPKTNPKKLSTPVEFASLFKRTHVGAYTFHRLGCLLINIGKPRTFTKPKA